MGISRIRRGLTMFIAAIFMACGSGGLAIAGGAGVAPVAVNTPVITIGYVNWTESVAVSHLMQVLLQNRFHYRVKLKPVTVTQAFKGVASGKLDAFLDVWLPRTHGNKWKIYADQVIDLGPWYKGHATLGLAVPNYVDAQSISDLKGQAAHFDGTIVGIQADAGEMRITRDRVIPAYGLQAYTLRPGSTADLVEDVDEAIHERKPIVFVAWKPHWLFSAYPVRYLDDPKNAYDQRDRIHVIVRKGLKDDAPQAYRLFDAFRLDQKQLGRLELTIANSRSAWGGVHRWLRSHQNVVAPWVADASVQRSDYLK